MKLSKGDKIVSKTLKRGLPKNLPKNIKGLDFGGKN
jgi:hypothetical protein